MNDNDLPISIQPIAIARATDEADVMVIEVKPEFGEALLLIEEYKHLLVLYWMHKFSEEQRQILQVHPRGDRTKALRGVFCVRSPMRPNPIGITRVELIKVEGNTLFVRGLDAFDGSPIIDIKSECRDHSGADNECDRCSGAGSA